MISSIAASASPRISYSMSGKDSNADGGVTFAEFMAPVPEGETVLTPADPSSSPTMRQTFAAYDHNGDGVVSDAEFGGSMAPKHAQSGATNDISTSQWLATYL